jgi:hypothetical protein
MSVSIGLSRNWSAYNIARGVKGKTAGTGRSLLRIRKRRLHTAGNAALSFAAQSATASRRSNDDGKAAGYLECVLAGLVPLLMAAALTAGRGSAAGAVTRARTRPARRAVPDLR